MILLPAIDLLGGRVVSLVGGQPGTEQVQLPDPVAVARRWIEEGAQGLHVVDLDAALGRGDNRAMIQGLLEATSVPVNVGGGVRKEEDVRGLLEAGAHRVVVGTRGVHDLHWLGRVARTHPGRVVLALDARDGVVVAKGWTEATGRPLLEMVRDVEDLPLGGLLYTAVHVEGRLQGVDRTWTPRLVDATRHAVYASGGVTSLDDVRFLRDAGCAGAVLGLALYLDRFSLPQAKALAEVPSP
jgi:phosphoribosylformimino-5-aminoimidazole carboxamide ribotide isomerase